jgi:hypothetical protein
MSTTTWWPRELGVPTQSGIWGLSRFAYFPAMHLLAVQRVGRLTIYDTAGLEFRGAVSWRNDGADFVFLTQLGEQSVNRLRTCELTSVSIEHGDI